MNFKSRESSASRRAVPVPAPVRNPIRLVLFWLSKTDPRLVSVCSGWAIATQAAFGVFVFFSATLAFGAAHYTLSTLNTPPSLVPLIASTWAVFVLYLDREIAGSLNKATAFFRPLFSLCLGTLVAIPIELRIFEQRVDQELQRQYGQDNRSQLEKLHAEEAKLDQRRADLEGNLNDLRKQEADWGKILDSEAVGRVGLGRTGIPGAGPAFANARSQQASIRQQIREIRQDLEELDRQLPAERQRLDVQYRREEVGKITDFVTRYEALDKVIHSSDALYRLSWLITLALILVEMTPALLKLLTPHVDYHHLVNAEIRENVTRIDEISDRNYRLAIENPEVPRLSVAEKFTISRYGPLPTDNAARRDYDAKAQA